MDMQQKIDALNQEIHKLGKKIDLLENLIGAKIREVRKLEELTRVPGMPHWTKT